MLNQNSNDSIFYNNQYDEHIKTVTKLYDFPTLPFPTARPSYNPDVYLSLTITFIIFYVIIFLAVYLQLILILYYRHKRFSYQTGFLYLCLFWSLLRIVLFSFYFHNAADANKLPFVFYFLLYCFPSFLQFCTLCLLVLFFGQVYFKVARRFKYKKYRMVLRIILAIAVLFFLLSSIASSYITRELCLLKSIIKNCNVYRITVIRVTLTDSLFVIFGVLLGFYLFRLALMPTFNAIMKQHGTSRSQAVIVTIFTSFLFITRTIYNILAISVDKMKLPDFGFDWINVSDQADLVDLTETKKYITFSIVLLIWEIIPTSVVVIIFRIKRTEVSEYNKNADFMPKIVVGKSVFTDNQAINYSSYENGNINDEHASLINNSIRSNKTQRSSSISSYNSYSSKYDAIQNVPPLNFVNENYDFN